MSISILPDDVLVKVLSWSSPNTVATSRRLNSRINRLIDHYRLGRPKVDEFSVEVRTTAERTAPLGRLQMKRKDEEKGVSRRLVVTMKRNQKSRRIVDEIKGQSTSAVRQPNDLIGQAMKMVKIADRLSFDGVAMDSAFYSIISAKTNDLSEVSHLSFTLSRISVSESDMMSLLARTAVRSLSLDFCHLETDILSDKVLATLPRLNSLRVQPRSSSFHPSLTDETLRAWADRPPTTIQLYNCTTGCTLQGVVEFVKSCPPKTPVDWDFGHVQPTCHSSMAFLNLSMIPSFEVSIANDYLSRRVKFSSVDGLSKVAFNFQLLQDETNTTS